MFELIVAVVVATAVMAIIWAIWIALLDWLLG